MEMLSAINESFTQYAGAVIQSRALVDVRDGLKPSARQIFYCLHTDNFVSSKPFKKTLKAIGSSSRMYIHGDSSCEGVIMRAGQPFAMRYPLVEVEGSYGNLMESGNWAASRYTSSRLSGLSDCLFKDIEKDTINEWRDNYDDTEQYPMVLPTKGFYNLVNGSLGIATGAASSIPQWNLKEVNEALIKLLWNPDTDYEEIYCVPDFATGAYLINEPEVKEILKEGRGGSCKLRAVVEYDDKDRCLIVKEIPYGLYTNTICAELEAILESDENPGIDRFNDLTGKEPNIKIYLEKRASPDRVLRYLYKNTSLQSFYTINMTMLKDGRFPMVFGWKEALLEHLNHEKEVYRKGFEFDLAKIEKRLHIVEGLLIATDNIDEVVKTIKASKSPADASTNLIKKFELTQPQAEAILAMRLSKLAHLEVEKLLDEKKALKKELKRINAILESEVLFKQEIEKGLREIMEKYGDDRRTKIISMPDEEDEEPTEIKPLTISLTNQNNLLISERSDLFTQKRGSVGSRFALREGEMVISSIQAETIDTILLFSDKGLYYSIDAYKIADDSKVAVERLIKLGKNERICAITSFNKKEKKENIVFITKNGLLKKSAISEYSTKRQVGTKALNLEPNDSIVSILFIDDEPIGMMSGGGQFVKVSTKDIRPVGRVSTGIRGMKVNEGDYVVSARVVPKETEEIVCVASNGLAKRVKATEFSVQQTNTKGKRISKVKEGSLMVDFIPVKDEQEITFSSTYSQVKVKKTDISLLATNAYGTKAIKLKDGAQVIGIEAY